MSKQEQFKQAVEKFKNSKQTTNDYLDLIIVSRSVLAQGSGLLWEQIEEILKEVIGK